jgi:eukaryotic-like serine/threonine-protein kinase
MLRSMTAESNAASPKKPAPGREEAIFDAALPLPREERAGYLAQACGQDASLRQRVEALLQASDEAGDFLEAPPPAAGPGPTLVVSAPVTEKPGDIIGRYKIREKLGEGGCGVVYVAEQAEPVRRRVALKIIKLGMDTRSVIARFEAERQALAMMDHPNIARVLDAGTTETGRPYFVMELVRGIRITEYCDQNNLNTTHRLNLCIQVCHAIQHAHQKGVIHRDIKPSNILVTLHDGVPVPKVIDFGIAKATEGRLTDLTVYTELHQFIGTPAYMSPEQAEMSGLDIDTRSDIYSLGVLLYELLTGRTPFDAQELVKSGLDQMRRTIREEEPPRPSTRLSTMLGADLTAVAKRHGAEAPKLVHFIRGDLDWIVMKALEKDRTRRYETASALAMDVQRFLRNEPVEARPPSSVYRFQKLVRRNKTVFIAAVAVTVALLLGFGLSLYLFLREATLRQQAEKGWALEKRLREISPVANTLATAGYLLSRGEFDQAEALMSQVPPIVTQCSAVFNMIGDRHARQGEWQAALRNYSLSMRADPTNHYAYHLATPVLVELGDLAGYREHRQKMLQRFSGTSDPTVAQRLGRDSLLLPPSASELESTAKMADLATASPTNNGWMKFTKGFTEYRQGHFDRAQAWLKDAAAQATDPALQLQVEMVLAMAQYQMKQSEIARATLAKGLAFAKANVPQRDGLNWNDRLSAYLLMSEAKALLQNAPAAEGGPK